MVEDLKKIGKYIVEILIEYVIRNNFSTNFFQCYGAIVILSSREEYYLIYYKSILYI